MTQKICTDDSVLDFLYKILQSSLFMKTENDVIGVVEDFYESMKLSKSVITEIDYILKTAGLIRDTSGFIENEISGEVSLKIFKSYPQTGFVAEPNFTSICSNPIGFATIGQPDSVCHQWSITGIGMCC